MYGADPEDLLDEQDAGPVPGLREPDVEVERAVVDGDLVGAVVGMGGIIAPSWYRTSTRP